MPKKIRVVIADDEDNYRKAIQKVLTTATDIEVLAVCRDGQEALDACQAEVPDVLLTDINMPRLSGIEVTRKLLRKEKDVHVVILTVREDEDTVFDAFRTYRGALGMRDSANLTNSFSSALPATSQLWALNRAELESVGICRTGVQGVEHIIRFANFGRLNAAAGNSFNGGNNYIYVDGSAKYQNFLATFNTQAWQWGLAGYSMGGAPVIDRNTNLPVQ